LYSDKEDQNVTGKEQAMLWSKYFDRFIESRQELGMEDQIIDLKFEDFLADQVGTIKKIYDRFGWDLSDEAINNFKIFIDNNPREKHGKHVYSLDAFALKEDEINQKFRKYLDFYEQL